MLLKNENGYSSSYAPERVFKLRRKAVQLDMQLKLELERKGAHQDNRTLDELIDVWYRLHGKVLKDHVRLRKLLYRTSERLGNPIASQLTASTFSSYREERTKTISTTTANREHSYLRAMFNELERLGVITFPNPLVKIRQFREREGELRYLSHDEIDQLLEACAASSNRSLIYVVKVCLATGARWDEAESLKPSQIKDGKITFLNTKSGKNRSVPIQPWLFEELHSIEPVSDSKIFLSSLSAFRKAVSRTGIVLPKGQMTHVLRHTFASHYVINGGNIVKLRDTLGHSEITTTMRYAHLAPEHLEEALELNPLNKHR
ncbi:phage integrase [Enterovibrio nigricans]|uniref:Site-specific recombinase XerD n=1 Tax=Enterovibrio nigricans DSM 22720 TaxID=1121868 RepID=A0A1T4UR79_9GAMM|nr:tyrosine-type recombinase/integrase [Enterovibrio nigricans]PKF50673.1 integrase [Enterovibrio nigricans]SKA55146.1 Site-specific recombinase XerD [Enterovibrio nigricans DSM 22720]